MTSQLRVINRV